MSFRVAYWGLNSDKIFDQFLLVEEEGAEIFQALAQRGQNKSEKQLQRECGRVVSKLMALVSAFFADTHYLLYTNQPPQLPILLPQLLEGLENIPVVKRMVSQLLQDYIETLEQLKFDRAALVPDLAFSMAEGVAGIDQGYGHAMLNLGLKAWLEVRTGSSEGNIGERMQAALAVGDEPFLRRVQGIYEQLQDGKTVQVLEGWCVKLARLELEAFRESASAPRRLEAENHSLMVDLDNGVTFELVSISAGRFTMGDNNGDADEKPAHEVNVSAFLMGKYQVTQKQWEAVSKLPQVSISLQTRPSHFYGDDRPVEKISWHEAVEFCKRLEKKTNRQFRLPSEAEWEYACRAGSTTSYCFGSSDSQLGNYAWFNGNSGSETHPVGQKSPNNWGLHDMHGNVWEWCGDYWHSNYQGCPSDSKYWLSSDDSASRLLRGGSWSNSSGNCRSAGRYNGNPDYRLSNVGFRLACSIAPPRT